MVTRYASATEFRNETNMTSAEWSDTQLEQMLDNATVLIDKRTGRTWQAVGTVTDELYDGDGTTQLWLERGDIQSVTALSINENFVGTFTSVTPSFVRIYSDEGLIELDVENESSIEVDSFTKGPQTVKVSYTYGFATPTDDVKELCIMMVEQKLNPTEEGKIKVVEAIKRLRRIDIETID